MNPSNIALAALLYSRCGRGLIAASDLTACAASLPNGASSSAPALAHGLVIDGLLAAATDRAWSLTPQAIAALSLPSDELSLTADEERQLVQALQQRAAGGVLGRDDLHAVTRRFLEEVLHGAMIPDELLEKIVDACRAKGRLTMSDDGGRYTITVPGE
jgi:hypothetical protein